MHFKSILYTHTHAYYVVLQTNQQTKALFHASHIHWAIREKKNEYLSAFVVDLNRNATRFQQYALVHKHSERNKNKIEKKGEHMEDKHVDECVRKFSFRFVSFNANASITSAYPSVAKRVFHLFNSYFLFRLSISYSNGVFAENKRRATHKESGQKIVDFYFWITFCMELTRWMWTKCKIAKFLPAEYISSVRARYFVWKSVGRIVIYLYDCLACMANVYLRVSKQKDHNEHTKNVRFMNRIEIKSLQVAVAAAAAAAAA